MAETMRGMRLGSQSLESETGVEFSPRQSVLFACSQGHEFKMFFAQGVDLPLTWECKSCSETATRIEDGSPVDLSSTIGEPARTHFDMVLERRSREELEELLQEVLADMRERRASGRLTA